MRQAKSDFIAEAIADYEAMNQEEQGKMIVQVLEDQPVLMGFITNLSDDFSDAQHEAIVDSAVILINAFISASIPVELVPHQMVEEVIKDKVDSYEEKAKELTEVSTASLMELSDSPKVFEDLRNRALFKSKNSETGPEVQLNFHMALDTVVSIIERSVAYEMEKS